MKILFIGCVESSYSLLGKLIEINANVVGVITKEHSNFNSDYCDLRPLCVKGHIPCCVVNNINDDISRCFIETLKPDIGFCFGWSQLLKKDLIDMFPNGVVGFHPAALPSNRGRHPIVWALVLGLEQTASSFFMINCGADEGDIISQVSIPIDYKDDAGTLYSKIIDAAVDQEVKLVEDFENGRVERIVQDRNAGNYWRKRGKSDGVIDWRMSSRSIYNLVRALTRPYVGAHFTYNGGEYKVWKIEEVYTDSYANIEPGKVIAVDENLIDVKTADGVVRLIDHDSIDICEGDYIL